jgi:hypothetical protein
MFRCLHRFLVAASFSVAVLGCRSKPAPVDPEETSTPTQPVAVDVQSFRFSSPELKQRFTQFDKAARQFAGNDFQHRPFQRGGNFVTAVWAKGIGFTEPPVLRGPREKLKDIHRVSVDTIVIGETDARSAALSVETVASNPDAWSVYFNFREGANRVTGPGWSMWFFRWDVAKLHVIPFRPDENTREKVPLPLHGYAVRDSEVSLGKQVSMSEDFLRHARSADALRDAYLADLEQLEQKVVAFIEAHKAQKKVFGPHSGGGIPPPHHLEPLSAEEEKTELAKAKQFFATQAAIMREHHVSMYAAFRRAFPVEQCWPELAGK